MERKYTESEMRWAFIKAMDGGGCWNDVLAELNGPRLKPDCHVEDADGIGWDDALQAETNGAGPPFIALIRADRVMEWAREYDTMDEYVPEYFERRIREETEVSDD